MKKVGVTGAAGFIGRAVVAALRKRGDYVRALVRDPGAVSFVAGVEVRALDVMQTNGSHAFEDLDAVIHLAGETIAGKWTAEKKEKIRASRALGTRNVVAAIRTCERPPKTLLSASASGYYGDRSDTPLEESDAPGSDFLAHVCVAWEAEAQRAAQWGVRVVCLRQGLVWGPNGGALQAMLPPFSWGVGGPLGSGRQWWPWIHLDDLAELYLFALDHSEISGALNAVSPDVTTNARFAHALGHALGRPALAPAPAFALKAILGEFADSLFASQLILPAKAEDSGFVWRHEFLEQALLDIFASNQKAAISHFESRQVVAADPLAPATMRRGTVVEQKLRIRGFPVHWKSLLVRAKPGENFTDVQLSGPFQLWRHRHEFSSVTEGVEVRDQVDYTLPLAPLSNLALPLVRRDLERIFRYRQGRIAALLSGDRS